MKFKYPFKQYAITQGFSKNLNTYYAESGFKGHTGIDMKAMGDQTIYAAADGYVYSLLNKDNPDLMRYRAVYTLVHDIDAGLYYEVSYGHCSDIYAKVGDTVRAGDVLAKEGNTGSVAVSGQKITFEQKLNNPGIGAHLHFQVRLVKPVTTRKHDGTPYLVGQNGVLKKDDYYFEVENYGNGYVGCIDPMPFFEELKPVLKYGSSGELVKIVQKKVGATMDGIFGKQTMEKVIKFQKANNLVADGVVGKLTWEAIGK